MPRYSYKCKECSTFFPIDKRLNEIDNEECCPACGGDSVRIIQAPPVHLKGGGWSRDGRSNLLGDHPDFNNENFSQNDIKGMKD